jgi:polycomb protein EED
LHSLRQLLTILSVRWYNDLILSHACREDKIILWKVDNFKSDSTEVPDAPVPISKGVASKTSVIIPANSTSSTRSAWGGKLQRLHQFDLPDSLFIYMRFSIFHEIGRHPILVAGNQKSKAFFWDLQRVEESGTGEEAHHNGLLSLPRHIREGSSSSIASSTISAGSGTTKTKRKKTKELPRDRGIADPFRSIRAHKIIEVPKYAAFPFRQFSWSRDGQWCVGVGDGGFVNVFNRWEKGIPPLKADSDITPRIREKKPVIS